MKRYRLVVSRTFPDKHSRKGDETKFVEKIIGQIKIHTIRSNFDIWAKRIEKVQRGQAVIELYHWSGKPYQSNQIVFATLDKDSGCGVQALIFPERHISDANVCGDEYPNPTWYKGVLSSELAKNDGLSLDDFKEWFKDYDLSKTMVIIHFTKFRY